MEIVANSARRLWKDTLQQKFIQRKMDEASRCCKINAAKKE